MGCSDLSEAPDPVGGNHPTVSLGAPCGQGAPKLLVTAQRFWVPERAPYLPGLTLVPSWRDGTLTAKSSRMRVHGGFCRQQKDAFVRYVLLPAKRTREAGRGGGILPDAGTSTASIPFLLPPGGEKRVSRPPGGLCRDGRHLWPTREQGAPGSQSPAPRVLPRLLSERQPTGRSPSRPLPLRSVLTPWPPFTRASEGNGSGARGLSLSRV